MAIVQVKDLIEAGVHFGHRASRWNPKMRPYIYGKRNLIHIIDLRETVRGVLRAYRFLAKVAASGSLVVFVGTKRQAREAVEREAGRAAVFCRFAGCNLWSGREQDRASAVCTFCDTDFVGVDGQGGGKFATAGDLADAVSAAWRHGTPM